MSDKIDLRVNNIEFRWSDTNQKFEMIQWEERQIQNMPEYCYVIAFFEKCKEGYDMKTVGARYVEALVQNSEVVKIVSVYAFYILKAIFLTEEAIKENKLHKI